MEVKPSGSLASAPAADSITSPANQADKYHQGVPQYMTEVYDWAYVDPVKAHWLDHNLVVKLLLFFNDQRLMQAYLDHVRPGDKVWQLAHVYGDLVSKAALKVGPQGQFHLTDVTPIQIEHAQTKLAAMPWTKVVRSDAASFEPLVADGYNVICSFFLLHEVPDSKKHEIVNHMLDKLPQGGKAVFVDYHGPALWQPVRYILKLVNHYLEPFAHALWVNEIRSYANNADRFTWRKRSFFGGVYQCVIVEHADKLSKP